MKSAGDANYKSDTIGYHIKAPRNRGFFLSVISCLDELRNQLQGKYYGRQRQKVGITMIDEIKNMNGRMVMTNIRKTGLSVMGWCRKNEICYETTLSMLQGHSVKKDINIATAILEKLKSEGYYVAL